MVELAPRPRGRLQGRALEPREEVRTCGGKVRSSTGTYAVARRRTGSLERQQRHLISLLASSSKPSDTIGCSRNALRRIP